MTMPEHYVTVPLPDHERYRHWTSHVVVRAKITDPQFHGGKTEAIQLHDKSKDEPDLNRRWRIKRGVGPWIEFRNFKEADAYVRFIARLEK